MARGDRCKTPGCLTAVRRGTLCRVCLQSWVLGEENEQYSEVFEELTKAVRDYLWERERRSRRKYGMPIMSQCPYTKRMRTAMLRAEDILLTQAEENDSS